jgi:hypothetical protein
MTFTEVPLDDPRVAAALAELQALITAHYPTATFSTARGEDPEGMYLTATVDVDDTDDVVDQFIARLLDLQIEEGLPVYVIPVRPIARVAAELREHPVRPAPGSLFRTVHG